MEDSNEQDEEDEFDNQVLGNQLRPKYKGAQKGSYELYNVLTQL